MWTSLTWIAGILLSCVGYAADLSWLVESPEANSSLVVGRVVAVVTGETRRKYAPAVRFFEVEEQRTHERFSVEIKSEDRHFAVALPAGDYRLNRVQISEGPFVSMAQVNVAFR